MGWSLGQIWRIWLREFGTAVSNNLRQRTSLNGHRALHEEASAR
jgi:hypothetical protein